MAGPYDHLIPSVALETAAVPAEGSITGWFGGPEKEPAPEADPAWGANPFSAAEPAFPTPKPAEPVVPNDEGLWGTTAGAASRGYYGLRENVDTARFDLAQRQIARIDETERKRAASGLPLPESLARTREELRASIGPLIASVAGYRAEGGKTRPPKDVEAALQAKTFGEAWENFKKSPVSFIYTVGLESMVRNAPALAATIPAGIVAGPLGAGAVMGTASGMSEYASGIMDALSDEGVDVRDPKAIEAATSDPVRMERIRQRAAIKGGVVGGFDAASAGIASRVLPGIGGIANPFLKHGANAAAQMPIQGTLGAAGEGLGSLASGQDIQPGAILGEFFGEAFGTPGEIAAMRHAGRHGRIDTASNPSPTEQFNREASPGPYDHLVPSPSPTASPTEAPVAPAAVEGPAAETPPAVTPEAPARSVDDLGYYSAALEAAKEWKQPRGTPQQAIKYLKSRGVKDAEIETTGLDKFLADKKSVTREELASFLEQNRIRLMEATYDNNAARSERVAELERQARAAEERGDADTANRLWNESEALHMDLPKLDRETKFSPYSLIKFDPTNPTYVERVVYLPDEGMPASRDIRRKREEQQTATPERRAELDTEIAALDQNNYGFTSGHFPQPNIVGHYQASQQQDSAGKKVFTLSQIQSDWGQAVRENGVKDDAKIAALETKVSNAEAEVKKTGDAMHRAGKPGSPESDAAWAPHARAMDEFNRLDAELRTARSAVPDHPAVRTTDQWTNTTLRRALKDAVDSGAENIAIPSGDTVLSYNPGDEHGMQEFYDKIVPKNLMNLLRKMDPSVKPTKTATLKSHDGKSDLGKGFTVFPITDRVREAVRGGQPMFAKSMGSTIYDRVASGKNYNVHPVVANKVLKTAQSMDHMRPPGVTYYQVMKVEPGAIPEEYSATLKDSKGNEIAFSGPLTEIRDTRAIYVALDGRPAIISFRFDLAGDRNHGIRGEVSHESVHALWNSLPADVRAALLDHGDSLGILSTGLKKAFTNSQYMREAENVNDNITLFEIYHNAYQGDSMYRDMMDQEVAAHMMQWYVTGALTPEQVAPVQHILDGMLNGDFARGEMQPQNLPGVHVGKIGVEDSPMSAITAFHGSPHDFDQFSMDKIGTGEGAQAYGHGLYFAESDKVAGTYRDTLADKYAVTYDGVAPSRDAAVILHQNGYDIDKSLSDLASGLEAARGWKDAKLAARIQSNMAEIEALRGKQRDTSGRLYEVSIDANPEQFLDWDKPLSQQSEKVRRAFPADLHDMKGGDAYAHMERQLADAPWKDNAPVSVSTTPLKQQLLAQQQALQNLSSLPSAAPPNGRGVPELRGSEGISATLRNNGILGVRYADAMSRDKGGGTSNYVVFDDKLIKITKKDGKPVVGKERTDLIKGARKDGKDSGPMFSLTGDGGQRPQSALSVIKDFKGIRDPQGELRAILGRPSRGTKAKGNQKGYLPGVINNQTGMPMDRAREILIEKGFLQQDADLKDMYNLIERMANGERVVAQHDQDAEDAYKSRNADAADREEVLHHVNAYFEEHGLPNDLSPQEEIRVLELAREGMRVDDAIERLFVEQTDGRDERVATQEARSEDAPESNPTPQGQPRAPAVGAPVQNAPVNGTGSRQGGPQPQGAAPLIPPAGPVASATPPGIPPTPPHLPLTGGGPGGFRANRATAFQNMKRDVTQYLQNSEIRVRDLVEQAEQQRGGNTIADQNDPYLKMTLFHGKVGTLIEEGASAAQEIINDSAKLAKARNTDLETVRKLVNEYLIAQHAPERNAKHGDGAAGMTNAEAAQVMAVINSTSAAPDIKAIADKALAMNAKSLDMLHDAGVLSDSTYNTLNQTYQNHVPLNRIMANTDNIGAVLGGQSLDVKGTGIKRAKGSDREVSDVLGNIILNYEQAVLRSEKNIVDNATANFVDSYQSEMKDIAKVHVPKLIDIGERTGIPVFEQPTERDLQFYRDGIPTWVRFADADTAQAFKATGREPLGSVLKAAAVTTRTMASLATRFNPEFAAPNKMRDLQEAAVYMSAQNQIGAKGAMQMLKGDPASIKAVTDWAMGKDTAATRQYEEMKRLGGTTGGMGLSTRQEVGIKLAKLEKLSQSKGRRGIKAAIDAVDTFNTIFEDSTRLSAYKAALAAGLSKERAAAHAKESSINFNRFGTAGQTINALYMFSNASIQGTAKMARAMKNPKVAGAVIAITALAVAGASSWNDGIDKDWRKKITKWDRLNGLNFVIPNFGPTPEGKGGWIIKHNDGIRYISLPVAWGFKPLMVMGNAAYDAAKGVAGNVQDTIKDVLESSFQAFNPLGGNSFWQIVSPTFADIPVDVGSNMKWSGARIRPEGFPNTPDDVKYFKTLGDTVGGRLAIAATTKLQETWPHFEVSPASLHYVVETAFGGPGRTLGKILTTAVGAATGTEVKASDYPMWSRFYRSRTEEEVGLEALRGPGEEARKERERETRERFRGGERADATYKELRALSPAEAERKYDELRSTDPKLASEVGKRGAKEEENRTRVEDQIRGMTSRDGSRARYVAREVLKDVKPEEVPGKLDGLVTRKVINRKEASEIEDILAGRAGREPKPPKSRPIDFDALKKRDDAKKAAPVRGPYDHLVPKDTAPSSGPYDHLIPRR